VRVDDAIEQLRQQRASTRCGDLVRLLVEMGFAVQSTSRSPGHKVAKHPKIRGLRLNFDCGHGADPQVLTCYTDSVRRVLRQYRDELARIEAEQGAAGATENGP
jgi:hypothetical protein